MKKMKFIGVIFASFLVTIISLQTFFAKPKNDPIIYWASPNNCPMPLVYDTDPLTASFKHGTPIEQRGKEFRKYLSVSLKISVSGASGSGTIVVYDPDRNEAYVASCGHLWNGTRSAEELKGKSVKCKVTTWYHNDIKLDKPKTYRAELLFWSNTRGYDCSLLKFNPDWKPRYFPIAPVDYPTKKGTKQHSLGCDGGREVAHYDVEIVGFRGDDLVTNYNSPRPGRSGGGLLSDDGYYIGTCWGTSSYSGDGVGYFTPLKSIHQIYDRNNYGWILKIPRFGLAQRIPIRDWYNPNKIFPKNYIPLPGRDRMPLMRN